ncbi:MULTISPECIES: carbohydrate ABC transporter permease [unclassified Mycoplasma]|uniref:carbohydrate ABC transporter permease n=1 Tax=unclassified Mycoplasma TaxID=2683645 RepID=UPI00211C0545|nr:MULTISPECIES: ABC transporter permease subunit [unclassified Mycoplasma]UUM19752.1 ABC transporter permease subunit [Mycoplasma sp. 1578d]UUM24736.1 ABC transporter permease subunit [Mycoplasma sp. 3686d]
MEQLKLYNWYNKEFDPIVPQSGQTLKAYKHIAKVKIERMFSSLKFQQKVERDLFLRARSKLEANLKRELSSHRVAYINKVKVLKESYKNLNFTDTYQDFVKFELNKIIAKKKELIAYVKDFQKSLKDTDDSLEVKEQLLKKLQADTKIEEEKLFKKYRLFKQALKQKQNNYFNLSTPNNSDIVTRLFVEHINEKREFLQNQKRKYYREFLNQQDALKKEYKVQRYNIKLDYKKRILQAEYEYNEKFELNRQAILAKKEQFNQAINEHKSQIVDQEQHNIALMQSHKQTANEQIAQLKAQYQQELAKMEYFLADSQQKDTIYLTKTILDLPELNEQNLDSYKAQFTNEQNLMFNVIVSKVRGFVNKRYTKKIIKHFYKGQFLIKKGQLLKAHTYNGLFDIESGNAYQTLSSDLNKTRLEFLLEECQAAGQKSVMKANNLQAQEYEKLKKSIAQAKVDYKNALKTIKEKLASKAISKQAYKNLKIEAKINYKEAVNHTKLNNEVSRIKNTLWTLYFRRKAEMKIDKKIFESKINEAQKSIPTECIKHIRIWASIVGFILPGLSELIWFKQYAKGAIMLAFSVLFYAGFVPFSFGAYWDKIGGVFGLIDLGANIRNVELGILPDARYYLFGGVVSIILLVFTLIYFTISAIGARRVAIALQHGLRPSKWSSTKRWLNTSGFPWMISLFGWVLMLFVVATPVITSILISFTDFGFLHDPVTQKVSWVGLKQWGLWWIFRENRLITSLYRVISWTIVWSIFSTLLPVVLGIAIAILVNNNRLKGKKIFRLIYIIPWAIPVFITVTFFKNSFAGGDTGYFNAIFLKLGLIERPINWLFDNVLRVRVLVILIQTWISYAWIFMLVTGNLQSIPKDIYEAGSIDGAKGRHLFWFLTIPQLLAMIAPMLIGQFVGAFNNFTTISLFTGGGPEYLDATVFKEGTTDIIISWVFKIAQGAIKIESDQAFAAALTTLASLMTIAVSARGFIRTITRRD